MNFFLFNTYINAFSFLIYVFNNVFATIKSKMINENENDD